METQQVQFSQNKNLFNGFQFNTKIKIKTTRFGELEVDNNSVFNFPEGILGFSGLYKYFILDHPGGPFKWLQSFERWDLAFLILDPLLFKSDYNINIKKEELETINLNENSDILVYVMVVIPKNSKLMTANLQGPLLFNTKEKLAKQFILADSDYIHDYRILKD